MGKVCFNAGDLHQEKGLVGACRADSMRKVPPLKTDLRQTGGGFFSGTLRTFTNHEGDLPHEEVRHIVCVMKNANGKVFLHTHRRQNSIFRLFSIYV